MLFLKGILLALERNENLRQSVWKLQSSWGPYEPRVHTTFISLHSSWHTHLPLQIYSSNALSLCFLNTILNLNCPHNIHTWTHTHICRYTKTNTHTRDHIHTRTHRHTCNHLQKTILIDKDIHLDIPIHNAHIQTQTLAHSLILIKSHTRLYRYTSNTCIFILLCIQTCIPVYTCIYKHTHTTLHLYTQLELTTKDNHIKIIFPSSHTLWLNVSFHTHLT